MEEVVFRIWNKKQQRYESPPRNSMGVLSSLGGAKNSLRHAVSWGDKEEDFEIHACKLISPGENSDDQ